MREIEKERLVLVLAHEAQRLFAARVRPRTGVGIELEHRVTTHARQVGPRLGPVGMERPHVVRVGHAEPLVEAMARRQKRWEVPEMPLAEEGRRIAALARELGDGGLALGEPVRRGGDERARDADAIGVAAGEDRSARGGAHGLGRIEAREARTLAREPVEVGGREVAGSVAADVRPALVVGDDQHDIRPLDPRSGRFLREKSEQRDCREFHACSLAARARLAARSAEADKHPKRA